MTIIVNNATQKSPMMDALYGEKLSQVVYERCQELNPEFNKLVQEVVYDVFWKREGLSLKDKSLITIISLIMFNKEEQLTIHLKGFFNLGGTPEFIAEIIKYMKNSGYIQSSEKALDILINVTNKYLFEPNAISPNILALIDLVSHIAIGDNIKTKFRMEQLLANKAFSEKEIENIMIHQLVYCGFPCAMNGFSVLKSINDEKSKINL